MSASVFFTRVHEVKLQVFPQTLFFRLRIKMSHCISATKDQFLSIQKSLFVRKLLNNTFCSCVLPILTSKFSLQSRNSFSLQKSENYSGPSIMCLCTHIAIHLVQNGHSQKIVKNRILFARLANSYILTYSTHLSREY